MPHKEKIINLRKSYLVLIGQIFKTFFFFFFSFFISFNQN
jgi:hypothetical protein